MKKPNPTDAEIIEQAMQKFCHSPNCKTKHILPCGYVRQAIKEAIKLVRSVK